MAVVRFTATRSLASGYSPSDLVTMNLAPQVPNGLARSRLVSKSERVTISRKREVTYYGVDTSWQISTKPIAGTDADKMRMFLNSCEAGEVFLFSPYQVVGDSYSWTNAMLQSEGWSEARAAHVDTSTKGAADYFVYGFTILEV